MTYTIIAGKENEKCYVCGEQADVIVVGDTIDPETGYQDEMALCNECYPEMFNEVN